MQTKAGIHLSAVFTLYWPLADVSRFSFCPGIYSEDILKEAEKKGLYLIPVPISDFLKNRTEIPILPQSCSTDAEDLCFLTPAGALTEIIVPEIDIRGAV